MLIIFSCIKNHSEQFFGKGYGKMKRVIVAILAGVLSGLICVGMALSGSGELPWPLIPQILSSRALIGVAIGISLLWLGHWSIHGLVMGAVFSLPLAFSGLMTLIAPIMIKP